MRNQTLERLRCYSNEKQRFVVFTFADVFELLLSKESERKRFSAVFPKYEGNYEFEDAFAFVENEFKKKIKNPQEIGKFIYFYERPINALGKEEVEEMISWVKEVSSRF